MSTTRALETAKIVIHWDHLVAPIDLNSGKSQEISWKGTAKRVPGLVILAFSTALIGAVPTMILFSIAIPYYTYTAYEKTCVMSRDEKSPSVKQPLSDEEVDQLNQLGIDAILKARAEGKKVGLIIRREKDQQSLFNRVEMYDDSASFPTRQGCHREKAAHFVLTGPAKRTDDRTKVFEV